MSSAWFFYDDENLKQGPFSANEMRILAANGGIEPDTRIEHQNGKQALAKNVKGLLPGEVMAGTETEKSSAIENWIFPPPPQPPEKTGVSPFPEISAEQAKQESKAVFDSKKKSGVLGQRPFKIILVTIGVLLLAIGGAFALWSPRGQSLKTSREEKVETVAFHTGNGNMVQEKAEDDIKRDFAEYWKSEPVYLCDLSRKPNGFIKENWEERIDRWRDMSEGSPMAAFLFAECGWGQLETGIGFAEMLKLYRFAANAGLPEAKIRCAEMQLWGFPALSQKRSGLALKEVETLRGTKYDKMLSEVFVNQPMRRLKSEIIFKCFRDETFQCGMSKKEVIESLKKEILMTAVLVPENFPDHLHKDFIGFENSYCRIELNGSDVNYIWNSLSSPTVFRMIILFRDGKADSIQLEGCSKMPWQHLNQAGSEYKSLSNVDFN